MKTTPISNRFSVHTKIVDYIFNSNINLSIEKIELFSKEFIKFSNYEDGYILFSIVNESKRNLYLLLTRSSSHPKYELYEWELKEQILKTTDLIIHENISSTDLNNVLSDLDFSRELALSWIINESLDGYCCIPSNLKKREKYNSIFYDTNTNDEELKDLSNKIYKNIKQEYNQIIEDLSNTDTNFHISSNISSVKPYITIGKIESVKEIGNVRYFKINISHKNKIYSINSYSTNSLSNNKKFNSLFVFNSYCYESEIFKLLTSSIDNIPYNLIDNGRYIIISNRLNGISFSALSEDPKIDNKYLDKFESDSVEYITKVIKDNVFLEGYVDIPSKKIRLNYEGYYNKNSDNPIHYNRIIKSLRSIKEEYDYLTNINTVNTEIINITEKVIFNSNTGELYYNDFSIQIDDLEVKDRIYKKCNKYILDYFRQEITEQDILNNAIKIVFEALEEKLNKVHKENYDITITLNKNIPIVIKSKVLERKKEYINRFNEKIDKDIETQYFYINDQRFNKKEIILFLKEIACYRNINEVNNFIATVGRLGLSVYIGITTGYEVTIDNNTQLYKFKKLHGRSNYELLLGSTPVLIKGKELINLLYNNFIGNAPDNFSQKLPELILKLSGSISEYIKYRSQINSVYINYKEQALNYLKKKVEDLNGEFVSYYNRSNSHKYEGIKILGLSGNTYIIAYSNSDSFVFLNPSFNKEKNFWESGKYICMIDQSNIKSNISYDTIIAKMMAIKNDSSIAHTIYNLQEEL